MGSTHHYNLEALAAALRLEVGVKGAGVLEADALEAEALEVPAANFQHSVDLAWRKMILRQGAWHPGTATVGQ